MKLLFYLQEFAHAQNVKATTNNLEHISATEERFGFSRVMIENKEQCL